MKITFSKKKKREREREREREKGDLSYNPSLGWSNSTINTFSIGLFWRKTMPNIELGSYSPITSADESFVFARVKGTSREHRRSCEGQRGRKSSEGRRCACQLAWTGTPTLTIVGTSTVIPSTRRLTDGLSSRRLLSGGSSWASPTAGSRTLAFTRWGSPTRPGRLLPVPMSTMTTVNYYYIGSSIYASHSELYNTLPLLCTPKEAPTLTQKKHPSHI